MVFNRGSALILVLVLLLLATSTAAGYFYWQNRQLTRYEINQSITQRSTNSPSIPTMIVRDYKATGKCANYSKLLNSQFLDSYIVKPGDSLLTIASSQLGSSDRINEIIRLNHKIFPELDTNSFIEIGWSLYLPPKSISRSSGELAAYYGEIKEFRDKNPREYTIQTSILNDATLAVVDTHAHHLDKAFYQKGDCVGFILDLWDPQGILLIGLQSNPLLGLDRPKKF